MPKLQHIRSTTPDKRPDPALLSDGQLAINTSAATPGFYTKNDAGGLVKIGPTFVGSAAPNSSPSGSAGNSVGEHWMDTSVAPPVLRVWDGANWIASQGLTGPAGEVGAAGPQGPAGNDGAAGPQGPAGIDGAPGAQGPAGVDGAAGGQGSPGVDGAAGPQGSPGVDGAAGGQGPQGEVGPQGPAGIDGAVGGQGPAGIDGAAGPQGEVGAQGPAGIDGAVGGIGPQGEVGPQGPAGIDGAAGPQGAPGNDGAAGPAGIDGAAGGQGAQGEVGLQGPPGADGAAGGQGPAGADGAAGGQGPQGEVGPQGPAGIDGAAGGQGPQGEVGPQGSPGADGAAGGQGPQGEVGAAGPAGADSTVPGPAGPAGPQGDSLFTLTPGDQIVPVEQIRTLQITGGSATSPAYSCIGGVGTGISFPSATELQLNTENVARLTINSAGGWNVNGSSSEVGLVLTGNGWAQPPSWQAPKGAAGGTLFASVAFSPKDSSFPLGNPQNIAAVANISQTGPGGPRDGRFAVIFIVPTTDTNYKVSTSTTSEDTHLTNAAPYMAWEQAGYRPYTKNTDGFNVYFVANDGTGRYPQESDVIVVV